MSDVLNALLENSSKTVTFPYDEISDEQLAREFDDSYYINTECDLLDDQKIILLKVFTGWTGIEYGTDPMTGKEFSEDEMIEELNIVRKFLRIDLNSTLRITGILAEINSIMFMNEFDPFTEDDLMGYVTLFHINVDALNDFQDQMDVEYSRLYIDGEVSNDDLIGQQEYNENRYLNKLKQTILHDKVKMLDRLRLWRWREEVLLSQVGDSLPVFPGIMSLFQPESASTINERGITSYYFRIGEVKREILMDRYTYFDIYHTAGRLAMGTKNDVEFTVDMHFEDLVDLLLLIIDDLAIDPRHLLTPLGVRIIFNREENEVIFNLSDKKKYGHNRERLYIACTHAGMLLKSKTIVEDMDDSITEIIEMKPDFVLIEELTSQYLSPQFYSVIENHRHVGDAILNIKTLNDERVFSGIGNEKLAKDVIFYGIGDGLSRYQVFTARELADTFLDSCNFFNPWSIVENPNDPHLWQRFSEQSVRRLLKIVIPRLEKNPEDKIAIEDLKRSIVDCLDSIDENDDTVSGYIKPKNRQQRIITMINSKINHLKGDIGLFLSFLFNLGKQFSDWQEDMIGLNEIAISIAIHDDPNIKIMNPEWSINLTGKIFTMVTYDVEKYIHMINEEDGKDYGNYFKELRLVKFYNHSYRIDWNDELATIGGQLNKIVNANKLGLYEFIRSSGNWFISTANYYSTIFLGSPIVDIEISLTARPVDLDDLIV